MTVSTPARHNLEIALIATQTFVVLFLTLHDFVPLGRFNNLAAIRRQDSLAHSIQVTLLGAVPASIGLIFSVRSLGQAYPHWLNDYLWITYGFFFYGLLRAWWIPYLVHPDPDRAARYQVIFAGNHSFLPPHNGIVPDTLHSIFHVAVVATLILLFLR